MVKWCFHILLALCLSAQSAVASAPIGAPPKDVAEAFSESAVVFLGKVEKVTKDRFGYLSMAKVQVETYWKGGEFLRQTVDVDGSGGPTYSARIFEVGKTYLFFLPARGSSLPFRADSYLNRVLPQSEASKDLQFLSKFKAKKIGGGPTNQ